MLSHLEETMGLCLCVGLKADLKHNDAEGYKYYCEIFAKVNQALRSAGLPEHNEPDDIVPDSFVSMDMYGYSGLHYLRRVAAHLAYTGNLPTPGNDNASGDPLLQRYYKESCNGEKTSRNFLAFFRKPVPPPDFGFNHLIDHSDCEGFYLPTDFESVVFPDPALKIPGEMIGSSVRLLRECERLSKALQIPPDVDPEDGGLYLLLDTQGEQQGWRGFGVESFTCVRLMHACQMSIRSGAALVFG